MPPGSPEVVSFPHTSETSTRPLVVAHRGASGYLPEHTLACYELAIRQGADFLEPDVVATADGELVVRHENEIGATTDVGRRAAFADRRTTKVVDGVRVTGWFTEDFTLAELKTLRAVERLPHIRPGSALADGMHEVLTLAEVLALAGRSRTRDGGRVAVLVEIKHPTYFAARGLALEPRVLAALDAAGCGTAADPVLIQCFETATLRRLAEQSSVRLGQLVDSHGAPYDLRAAGDPRRSADLLTPSGLAEVSRYADVIGLAKNLIIPRDPQGRLARPNPVVEHAHAEGLGVWGWTFRRENRFLPLDLRSSRDPDAPGDLAAELAAYLAAGVDGLITDHPDVTDVARRAHRAVPVPAGASPSPLAPALA